MGLLPCPLPCNSHAADSSEHQSSHSRHLHSESSSSLSSQSSLPSVPSLTSHRSHPLDQSPAPAHHCCVATLSGHSSYVSSLALGKFLYSGSSDGEVRAWPRSPLGSHPEHVAVVAATVGLSAVKSVIARGDNLFTAHQDHKIRVWRIDAEGRYRLVTSLPTMPDRLARLFSAKNYVEVRRHKKCTWVHHVDAVSSLALTHDGSVLYSASWDRSFKAWRVSDFRCMESVERAHDDAINAVVVSRDGHVYTCSADRRIKVWKKESHQRKHVLVSILERHRSAVNALALSEDGCILYSGACDRSILVWEKVQDEEQNEGLDGSGEGERYMVLAGALRGHTKAILCLAVAGDVLCSGSADHTVRVWRRKGADRSYCCLAVCEGHAKPVKCLAASVDVDGNEEGSGSHSANDGTRYLVYSGGLDWKIKVWRIWVPQL